MDALFFGVLLSYAYHTKPQLFLRVARRFRHLLFAAGLALLLPAFVLPVETTPFVHTLGLTVFYLGSGCLLVSAFGFPAPATWWGRGVAYAGSHSYSVYLWHMPVALLSRSVAARLPDAPSSWFIYCATYVVGSLAIGILMAVVIEFPVLKLRDRLFPSRARPLSTGRTGSTAALT
jgi:peptidoglycan/LPS O-acetylase OafA/YrhL